MSDSERQGGGAESAAALEATLGVMLRSAREAQQLTIEEISGELRIAREHLLALEEDRIEALGAPVFAKGYLKQYGRRLGLSYNDLLTQYHLQAQPEEVYIAPARPIRLRDERQIGAWVAAAAALVLLAGALGLWWVSDAPVSSTSLRAAAPAAAGSTSSIGSDVSTTEPERPASSSAVPLPPLSGPPATPAESGNPQPVTLGDLPAVAEEPAAERSAAPEVALGIEFDEDCWTEVTDARGERLYYGLGRAGTRSVVHGEGPLRVFVGNVNGVRLEVNGSDFAVPARARRGDLATFSIASPGP